ncbi:T9SS type A sorting domain-containing protein [Tamlana fucoidanivorans]|uniref:T9SS type A sorting domain-containing protein n=1 Tax=Allotamlana fucoidanivorans TaxID=2583814 RepID=A0A5C4SJT1_9FLAO|nr:T9SS type A sorting domain-containing protein [Tamlana fucoidanivorans]TNJ44167.1 T9SS type A sorting domain-containing protein [Tamlana fucoidanivorans]
MRNIRKLLVVICCFLLNQQINAQFVKEVPLDRQVDNSVMIIEGVVTSQKCMWDINKLNIYTISTVSVAKVFKGKSLNTVEVVTVGGTVGAEALIVYPNLKLFSGDRGLFILRPNKVSLSLTSKSRLERYNPVTSTQSFFKYGLLNRNEVSLYGKGKSTRQALYDKIMKLTGEAFLEIKEFETKSLVNNKTNERAKILVPSNISFSPAEVTAGTGFELTITGSGFGSNDNRGKVGFKNADDGDPGSFIFALNTQIKEWSDTQIIVEVPHNAGTGKVLVQDNNGNNAASINNLIVTSAQFNVSIDPDDATTQDPPGVNGPLDMYAYQTRHINDEGGGYVWEMYTDFFNDTNSKTAFETSLEKWRCETKVNWVISNSPTTTNATVADGINVVRYDDLDDDVLGRCYSRIAGCGNLGDPDSWYAHVYELDIVFDNGTTEWYFGEDPIELPDLGKFDFESVALHELGHGHQLGHVVDESGGDNEGEVMHFALQTAEQQRVLNVNNIAAAQAVHNRSKTISECGVFPMTDSNICNLSTNEVDLVSQLKIYPNPSTGFFYIDYPLPLDKVVVHDLRGRKVLVTHFSTNEIDYQINLQGVAKGVYVIKIFSKQASITQKLVKN